MNTTGYLLSENRRPQSIRLTFPIKKSQKIRNILSKKCHDYKNSLWKDKEKQTTQNFKNNLSEDDKFCDASTGGKLYMKN